MYVCRITNLCRNNFRKTKYYQQKVVLSLEFLVPEGPIVWGKVLCTIGGYLGSIKLERDVRILEHFCAWQWAGGTRFMGASCRCLKFTLNLVSQEYWTFASTRTTFRFCVFQQNLQNCSRSVSEGKTRNRSKCALICRCVFEKNHQTITCRFDN